MMMIIAIMMMMTMMMMIIIIIMTMMMIIIIIMTMTKLSPENLCDFKNLRTLLLKINYAKEVLES